MDDKFVVDFEATVKQLKDSHNKRIRQMAETYANLIELLDMGAYDEVREVLVELHKFYADYKG